MKPGPVVPAHIAFPDDGTPPHAPDFGDVYHPRAGALAQAGHVFLQGTGLPRRWAGRRRFVVLETGFGLGLNFLATWAAWQADAQRCGQLVFVSIDKHPPRRDDLVRAHERASLPPAVQALAAALQGAWPPPTPDLHLLDFEGGRVRLLLALGDVAAWLPALQLQADAIFLDGFAPDRNPAMWDPSLLKRLSRLAAPGAIAATWSAARPVRDALAQAGFAVERVPGWAHKREMTQARFTPRHMPRRAPGRAAAVVDGDAREGPPEGPSPRHALILGAGLAGAAAADALVRAGWRCTVIERHAAPAAEASGNPAGLFHGTAHADDGPHARFTRAAALLAARRYGPLIHEGRVPGQCEGFVHARATTLPAGLPPDYVHASDAEAVARLAGLPRAASAGWFYPAGGWIAPGALVRQLLAHERIRVVTGTAAVRASHAAGGWTLFDPAGHPIASAPVLVLATGAAGLPAGLTVDPWPMGTQRGQVSWFASRHGPARPIGGHGYALTLPGGQVLCGATSQPGDADPSVRDADHAFNLQRLEALTGLQAAPGAERHGRVGWRSVTLDRLPVVGAVPVPAAALPPGARVDQARAVPRQPGLYVIGGLGSRGLTWAPLAAELLAAWIDGAPLPVPGDLVDAVDPARWRARQVRRAGAGRGPDAPPSPGSSVA